MRLRTILFTAAATLLLLSSRASSQWNNEGLNAGIGFGGTYPKTELADQLSFQTRVFLRYGLIEHLQGEIGGGIGLLLGEEYKTQIIPVDVRLVVSPFTFDSWNPYVYGGIGVVYYDMQKIPAVTSPNAKFTDKATLIPVGAGVQFKIDDLRTVDINGGYNHTSTADLNGVRTARNRDSYWGVMIGLTSTHESGSADPDLDGLTNDEEKALGTDHKIADTDGDGINDGMEVNKYKTNPLKADSDGDGLSDGDEVNKYMTDPNKADTDGDGLNDNDELNKAKTDPNKADTDGDGLNDGGEVNQYKTSPVKPDTDGDGLNDGAEVNQYKTDPLKADTDGGTVNDGQEITDMKNPLDPSDDLKKEEIKVEVGQAIVLDGVTFASGKAEIAPESEVILEKAYNTLNQNPDIEVSIEGYTDNSGGKKLNMKLSQKRADAVKDYLVKKGIDGKRIATKGYGPENPIAPNDTPENKQKNRRIEFKRLK